MGLILDSSVVIAAEQRGDTVEQLIEKIVKTTGDQEAALSASGDVIAWVMHSEGVSFRHAVELLREDSPLATNTRPDSGGTTTFEYDPFGRRIQKSGPLGITNYLYNRSNVLADENKSLADANRWMVHADVVCRFCT